MEKHRDGFATKVINDYSGEHFDSTNKMKFHDLNDFILVTKKNISLNNNSLFIFNVNLLGITVLLYFIIYLFN